MKIKRKQTVFVVFSALLILTVVFYLLRPAPTKAEIALKNLSEMIKRIEERGFDVTEAKILYQEASSECKKENWENCLELIKEAEEKLPLIFVNYLGSFLEFSVDLREAKNMQVLPDENSLENLLWNPEIRSIKIVFKDTTDLGLVAVQAYDIAYKLTIAYKKFNYSVNISAQEVDSFENLKATKQNVFIVLVPPSISNESIIRVEDSTIFIKAKTKDESDLITAKFLIVALKIMI